ncbi:molybdate ABC transporter permease subunit, partial [Kosakonia sp. H7A]
MNTLSATPPPLPRTPTPPVRPPRRYRFGIPGWLIALIAAVLLFFALLCGLIA